MKTQHSLPNLFRFNVKIFFWISITTFFRGVYFHTTPICIVQFVLHRIAVPGTIRNGDLKRYKRDNSYGQFRVNRWKTKCPNEYFGFLTNTLVCQHNPCSLVNVPRIGHVDNYAILWRLQHYLFGRMQTKTIPNRRVFNRYRSIDKKFNWLVWITTKNRCNSTGLFCTHDVLIRSTIRFATGFENRSTPYSMYKQKWSLQIKN